MPPGAAPLVAASYTPDLDPYADPARYCRWLEVQRQVTDRFPAATGQQRDALLDAGMAAVAAPGTGLEFDRNLENALTASWRKLHRARGRARPALARPRARRRSHRPRVSRGPPDDKEGDHPGVGARHGGGR
jgi:hypothetical protein